MGLLPFDDWIYHLSFMRDEVNTKHTQVVQTQDTVQADVLAFNAQLDKYKQLIANNGLLVYISTAVQLDDLKLQDFTTTIDALPPPVNGDTVLNFLGGTVELIGGILVLKFVVNVGKMAKAKWFTPEDEGGEAPPNEIEMENLEDVGEDTMEDLGGDALDAGLSSTEESASTESLESLGEDITEETVETATSASLAATGIGIFLAVGMDAIFGAINGAKERDQLQDILDKLDAKMTIVNTYLNTVTGKVTEVNTNTVKQITLFKNIATGMTKLLPDGHKPTFSVDFPATLESLDTCLADQNLAITQFSLLLQLRNTYVNALARNPKVTKDTVVNAVLLTSPLWCTYDMLSQMWDQVLAKNSTLMKNAQ